MTEQRRSAGNFIRDTDKDWETVGKGVTRKVLGYDERVMMVRVAFEKGAVGEPHSHHHTQVTHIESGVFEVTIGDETQTLGAADCFYIPPNFVHGVVCLEAGVLADVFSPMRADFI
ncbi:MAG: cupin domain-containing protein [Gemmatimonadaceae bacterium]|nr:cupin domain-containing protein [Chitinophagaceae bacterium]